MAKRVQIEYRKNNKNKTNWNLNMIIITSERGYFVALWSTLNRLNGRKKWKTIEQKMDLKILMSFTIIGLNKNLYMVLKCPATGVKMTTKRFFNKPGEEKKKCMTNISVDRILSSKNYSPKNLIFTTWQYNCDKGGLSPKGARFFLKIAEERYGKKSI
jgi:hypothetical protein